MRGELMPYRDRQDAKVFARCHVCGRELYGPEDECRYCLRFVR